jgi:hypothetical protein
VPDILNRGEVQQTIWGGLEDHQMSQMFKLLRIKFENYKYDTYTDSWTLTARDLNTGKHWGAQCSFSAELLEQTSPSVVNQVLRDTAESLAQQISPHLYPYDPRIGTPLPGKAQREVHALPPCPLFDRVDMMGQVQSDTLRDVAWIHLSKRHARLAPDVSTTCPFCTQPMKVIGPRWPIVWGGGHLGWVHQGCLKDHGDSF